MCTYVGETVAKGRIEKRKATEKDNITKRKLRKKAKTGRREDWERGRRRKRK